MSRNINRRTFIKKSVAAGGAAAILPQTLFSSNIKKGIKLGFIGTGLRGQWMLWLATKYPDVDIGSYPYFKKKSFGVSLIIKSDSEKLVKEVCGLIYDYLEQQNGKPRLF